MNPTTEAGTPARRRKGNKKTREAAPAAAIQPASQKQEKPKETTMEFIGSMAAVLVSGLFIITFIMQAFEIPSKSMVNTLLVGDHLFVDRVRFAPPADWTAWFTPYRPVKRGDIIVFLSPAQAGLYLVKRVRGVPGDRIHLRGGKLYVNGQLQDEPFVVRDGTYNPYRDDFPSVPPAGDATFDWRLAMGSHVQGDDIVVPPDSYFAMGDNRDNSFDSRYWGFVPRENLIGRPLFIYWSFETPEDQYEKRDIGDRLAFIAKVIVHFFDETRWRRTLKMVR
ncbi:MAG TPA: signal peptidase I [Terriglobales bacterium]|nr:signal peptidase I [Terriglobales bacterium]